MINNDRIVPVQATDLLSLYGTMLIIGEVNVSKLEAGEIGEFTVAANGTYLANEPVKTLDFAATATAAEVYFIPAYDFEDITIAGAAEEVTVDPDGCTLYHAALSSGAVTVTKIAL